MKTQTVSLRPTLWRTCRVLANRRRLLLFRCLLEQPNQSVSDLAGQLEIPVEAASEYLRALNARGLLQARRSGRFVLYRVEAEASLPEAKRLVKSLGTVFRKKKDAVNCIFRMATAFTHPRRVIIVAILRERGFTRSELKRRTDISFPALGRHLDKLLRRGVITLADGVFRLAPARDALSRAFLDLSRLS